MWLLETFASRLDLLLAGLAGGFVGLYWYKDVKTWIGKIYLVICGGLSGMYAAPFAFQYFRMQSGDTEAAKNALAFLALAIGIFGPKLVQAVIKGLENAQLWEIIKARAWDVLQALANSKGKGS